MIRFVGMLAALTLPLLAPSAQAQTAPQAGDTYEIARTTETSEQTSDGSSGSSSDQDMVIERVIAVGEAGLELEYALPATSSAEERAHSWHYPARVLKPARGPMTLRNGHEMEARVDGWLKNNRITRAACGRWIFTWNAFRVECDVSSAIEALAALDMRPDFSAGSTYRAAYAVAPGVLTREPRADGGANFVAEMAIDPEAVRRRRAEEDVATAELSRKRLTFAAALRARSAEVISGAIKVTFAVDASGDVRRRTTVTVIEIKRADGASETRTAIETMDRRRIPARTRVVDPLST